jgi:hypothetical protein
LSLNFLATEAKILVLQSSNPSKNEAGRLVVQHKIDPRTSTFQERMKLMAIDTSATKRDEKPHANRTTRTATIIDALRRRAEAVLNDPSIDAESRAIIRYAMEVNDPWLAKLVRRADAGETIIAGNDFSEVHETTEAESSNEKIEALAEIICRAGDEPETKSAALLVLMGTLESAVHPKVLANTAKHFAFTRCGELNLYGMVDAQIALVEGELLASNGSD